MLDSKLIKPLLLALLISHVCVTTSALADDKDKDKVVFPMRIAFNNSGVDADGKTRIMLYSSKFSIYPQFSKPPTYYQGYQNYQSSGRHSGGGGGGGAGVALAAAVITVLGAMYLNHLNDVDRGEAAKFNSELEAALATIDINKELQQSLQTELSKVDRFKQMDFESVEHVNDLSQAGLLIRIEEPTILTVAVNVHFDEELKSLCVGANTKVWRKNNAVPIYFSDLDYTSAYLNGAKPEDLRKQWMGNDGELLKAKIREGIAEVTRMLVKELTVKATPVNGVPPPDDTYALSIETINPATNKKCQAPFYVSEDMPDRLVGRLGSPDSSLMASIPKRNVTLKSPH
ncbi:MAG TPA: hypothetical protein VIE17_06680 [Methylophilaceae bacterium]